MPPFWIAFPLTCLALLVGAVALGAWLDRREWRRWEELWRI